MIENKTANVSLQAYGFKSCISRARTSKLFAVFAFSFFHLKLFLFSNEQHYFVTNDVKNK